MAVVTQQHKKAAAPLARAAGAPSGHHSVVDIPLYHGRLLDAGSELLPLLHEASSLEKGTPAYAAVATAMWPLLRECWAAWWMLHSIWEPHQSWAEWQRCTGEWSLWQRAGLAGLVAFWMERVEAPYQITHAEMAALDRWLYGVPYQLKDRPATPPPFWVTEMLDPAVPF